MPKPPVTGWTATAVIVGMQVLMSSNVVPSGCPLLVKRSSDETGCKPIPLWTATIEPSGCTAKLVIEPVTPETVPAEPKVVSSAG